MIATISNIYIYAGLYMRKHMRKLRQLTDLKFEDSKGVIRIRKSEKDKRTNNDLQNTTQNTNDRATRTPQNNSIKKPGVVADVPEE